MKSTITAVSLAACAAALPTATLQALENSCITSGSTDRSCASVAWATELAEFDSRVQASGHGAAIDPFESRIATRDYGEPLEKFRSDEQKGFMAIVH